MASVEDWLAENRQDIKEILDKKNIDFGDRIQYKCMLCTTGMLLRAIKLSQRIRGNRTK